MELVIRDMHFFDIQNLRKTSSGIQKCVDIIKPDPHIFQYIIRIHDASKIYAEVTLANGQKRTITDQRVKGKPDFVCTVANDFHEHLRHQKTRLEELRLEFYSLDWHKDVLEAKLMINRFTESLQGFLKTMKTLKVGKLSIGSFRPHEFMQILPFTQSETLEMFYTFMSGTWYEWNLEVNQISQHWASAKELIIKALPVSTPIQKISIDHFVKVDICLRTISSQDVLFLKNLLLISSNFQKYKFAFRNSTIDDDLHALIGEPYRNMYGVRRIWYFRIGSTNDYMHIVLNTRDSDVRNGVPKNKSIVFSKVAKEDTPFF